MKTIRLAALAPALLIAACATVPPKHNKTLETARTKVNTVAEQPNAKRYAPVELEKARSALKKAVSANKKHDTPAVGHYSHMAVDHAMIAKAKTQTAVADATVKSAKEKRAKAVVHSRDKKIRELQSKLASLKPHRTDQGIVLTLGNVLFAVDSANLRGRAQAPLDKLASYLHAHRQNRLQVNGYTDSTGSESYNQKLSERRAQSVANALIDRGVDANRMRVIGHGENSPVASNDTRSGRQQNRRVEFVILNANNNGASSANDDTRRVPMNNQ